MSKTTKIIAALGVVSGLGVAAMPALTFADTSVSGNVKIEVEIEPAIAMRIHSNADQDCVDDDSDPETPDVCTDSYGVQSYNPATAQAAGEPAANVGPSLATGLKLSANQKDETTLFSNIEVRSNTGSFKIELLDADDNTSLNTATASSVANEYIPAGVSVDGEDNILPGTAGWAVKGGDIAAWTAVPAGASADYDAEQGTGTAAETPLTVLASGTNTTNPLAYSAATTVHYGVASGLTKTGVYSDIVTYTATAL